MTIKFEDLPLSEQLDKWQEAAKYARQWQVLELHMRNHLFKTQFPAPKLGTNKLKLDKLNDDGEQLAFVGTYKINFSIDKEGWLTAVKDKVIPPTLVDIVTWSPKLSESAYKALPADDLKIVAPFVTEKQATPTIEIKIASSMRW